MSLQFTCGNIAGNKPVLNRSWSPGRFSHPGTLRIFFCLMMALPFIADGQVTDKKKTIELLCHKWESDLSKSPKKMDCFPPDSSTSISFLTNGYVIFNEKKGAEGVWNYDANRNNLYVLINGSLWKYKINSLTATALAVEGLSGKTSTVYYLLRN